MGAVAEPYFQMASAFLIIAIALWMLWRTWRDQLRLRAAARVSMRIVMTMAVGWQGWMGVPTALQRFSSHLTRSPVRPILPLPLESTAD